MHGCLEVGGCNAHPRPPGATVEVGGVTTTTDRHGCFKARAQLGLAPLRFSVSVNTEQLEMPPRCNPNTR